MVSKQPYVQVGSPNRLTLPNYTTYNSVGGGHNNQ